MNDILKQRLVGALILVALGVVFWPIIFVQPADKPATAQQPIPPRPDVDATPLPAPDPAGLRSSPKLNGDTALAKTESNQEAIAAASQPEGNKTVSKPAMTVRSKAPEPLKMDEDGVPLAYILQVASVSSQQKADDIRKRLLEMQHKAYVKKVARNGDTLYRVYIGPKFERAKLESLRSSINKEFGVSSIVVRYLP